MFSAPLLRYRVYTRIIYVYMCDVYMQVWMYALYNIVFCRDL